MYDAYSTHVWICVYVCVVHSVNHTYVNYTRLHLNIYQYTTTYRITFKFIYLKNNYI